MKGWLVVNAFLNSEKWQNLYEMLYDAAKKQGIDLEIKDSCQLTCSVQEEFADFKKPDFAIFWDKDIPLAIRLENAGIKVFNNPRAIEICDNKVLTAINLHNNKIPTPKTFISPKTFEGVERKNLEFLKIAQKGIGYPMVIKEAYGSFGKEVYLAKNQTEAVKIIKDLKHKDFIMQEFIAESSGTDIRVNVVGDRVVSTMLRTNPNDFRSNITNGGEAQKYEPSDAQKEVAIKACKALNLDFAGVDILLNNGVPLVCEVNSNPHFKSTFECTGVNLACIIMEYIAENIK